MTKCYLCDEPLEGEEIDSPFKDEEGNPICDNCWDEYYRIFCHLCENSFDKKEWKHFLVPPEGFDGVIGVDKPGIYEILEYPFYVASVVTGIERIWSDRVRWVADIPENYQETWATYEVCPDCVKSLSISNNGKETPK